MKEFIDLDKYGQLYMDKVLFESYFPVIFTCINDNKDIFIGVCCQNNEKGCKWMLGKTDGISMIKMLRDESTIRQLLLECSSGKISVDYVDHRYSIAYHNLDWDEESLYLPKEDSYMYAENGEFEEEIAYFASLDDTMHYNENCYPCMTETYGTIHKGMEPIADALVVFASSMENLTISSEVVSTLKVFGELCVK